MATTTMKPKVKGAPKGTPLTWQASCAKATTPQKKIQNTTFIFPAGGTRSVKAP